MIYKLNENSYGGAYDIEDDMFFTREEIVEFGNDIAEEFSNLTGSDAYLSDIYFDNHNNLRVEIEDDSGIYDSKVFIDMRRIRLPRDIYKYKDIILDELKSQYNDYMSDIGLSESLDDDYDPESYDTNDVWTVVCVGDLENVKRLIMDPIEANERHRAFGREHSLIMGAARNDEVEVVDYLLKIGGTIEPHETFEFAKYIKKNSDRLTY